MKYNKISFLLILIFSSSLLFSQVHFQSINCFLESITLYPTANGSIALGIIGMEKVDMNKDKMLLGGIHSKVYGQMVPEKPFIVYNWFGYNAYVVDINNGEFTNIFRVNYKNMEGVQDGANPKPNTSSIKFSNMYITDDNQVEILTHKPKEFKMQGETGFQFGFSRYSFKSNPTQKELTGQGAAGILEYDYLNTLTEEEAERQGYTAFSFKKKTDYGEYMSMESCRRGSAEKRGTVWFSYYDHSGKKTKEIAYHSLKENKNEETGNTEKEFITISTHKEPIILEDGILIPMRCYFEIVDENSYPVDINYSDKLAKFNFNGELIYIKTLQGTGDQGDIATASFISPRSRYGDTLIYYVYEHYEDYREASSFTNDPKYDAFYKYRAIVEYNLKTDKIEKYVHCRPRKDYLILGILRAKNNDGYYFFGGQNEEIDKNSHLHDPIIGKISNKDGKILWVEKRMRYKGVDEVIISPRETEDGQYVYLHKITKFKKDSKSDSNPQVTRFMLFRTWNVNDNDRIEESPIENVQLYPNPANSKCTLSFNAEKDNQYLSIEVCNIMGKKLFDVYKGLTTSDKFTYSFNTQNLPNGTYHLTIKINDEIKQVELLVIER